MRILAILFILTCFFSSTSKAQDTLPKFSVVTKGNNKFIVSWTSPYSDIIQISIQRSKDSTRGFATILTVPDPTAQQNGFVDAKAPDAKQFYRLFVVRPGGQFFFTKSKRTDWDTIRVVALPKQSPENAQQRVLINNNVSAKQAEEIKEKVQTAVTPPPPVKIPEPEKFFFIKKRDTLLGQINTKDFKKFRDSIVTKTKDTIAFSSVDTILLKPFIPREVFKPSRYVYTEKYGNVTINLTGLAIGTHHYAIKFYEDDNTPLFDIAEVKEPILIIDKVNFLRSGWFRFELLEDGKLKEKHKFFVPKD